jgi:hypothetical protein
MGVLPCLGIKTDSFRDRLQATGENRLDEVADKLFQVLPDISSPASGGLPPRRFMSLSNALRSVRYLRSAKNSAVCKADSFSATAVATN